MVRSVKSSNLVAESGSALTSKIPVKLEIEDQLDDEHGPLHKRSKISAPLPQWSTGNGNIPQPAHYNPLDEPSPLGLRLRKSPSLLELIQMKLSQGNSSASGSMNGECIDLGKDSKGNGISATTDKLKASNFPASVLRIGTWECVSRYEGDLVAKCYFAKHKLVWEVLDGGLKNKIEIQWSDITALKATCPENGPGTLDIVLARQPLFFRETNPQPRKHTLWQATSDFTRGEASLRRRHFLQCPPGLLNKHFEKLIMCDPRLNMLSQQPEIGLDSPFFEPKASVFEDHDESKCHHFDNLTSDYVSTFVSFQDAQSPSAAQSSSCVTELKDPIGGGPEAVSHGTPSPNSAIDTQVNEETGGSSRTGLKELSQWDQFKVPGLHPSMSMSDLVTHIGNCISEHMTSGSPLLSGEGWQGKDILDEITQHLLGDSQFSSISDEQSLMSRVNSLCCLLQKETPTDQHSQVKTEACLESEDGSRSQVNATPESTQEKLGDFSASGGGPSDVSGCRQPPAMSRKDSLGDLLLHLPRIASLPQFLFNISEDFESQAR
ncbi:hypothetical protein AAC387_Pa04g0842 [Persea americana]